jgi:hypothetical protein
MIAIVGDADPKRTFTPSMKDAAKAKKAAEQLGIELAQRGAKLLVYGGPFLEADVVRGFVAGKQPRWLHPDELYARHAVPFAVGVGFVAGLTADAVFGKLLGLMRNHICHRFARSVRQAMQSS